jgi:hypothetical protein
MSMGEDKLTPTGGEILIYQTDDGEVKLDVRLESETLWLTQSDMAKLFQCSADNISLHLKNLYNEGELSQSATTEDFSVVRQEGNRTVTRKLAFFNLDAVISVGYRVKSSIATQFRIWATERLKEYIVKGFALNDDRFKSGNSMNYFNELQERIRQIRLSERFFYQKIKDIYTTSVDYDPKDEKTVEFFKIVQNKLLWAISEQTAAELVYRRVDAALPLMGMQSFDKPGSTVVRKSDVSVAKNYLNEDEIRLLGLLVEQYLAFAETMAHQHTPMYMKDWSQRLDAIIQLNGRELLTHAGKTSHQMALERSAAEYEKFKEEKRALERATSLNELEADVKSLASLGSNLPGEDKS